MNSFRCFISRIVLCVSILARKEKTMYSGSDPHAMSTSLGVKHSLLSLKLPKTQINISTQISTQILSFKTFGFFFSITILLFNNIVHHEPLRAATVSVPFLISTICGQMQGKWPIASSEHPSSYACAPNF